MTTTQIDYIKKNMRFSRNINGHWTAHFTCADGYSYSSAAAGNAKVAKPHAASNLVDRVLQGRHPIF